METVASFVGDALGAAILSVMLYYPFLQEVETCNGYMEAHGIVVLKLVV